MLRLRISMDSPTATELLISLDRLQISKSKILKTKEASTAYPPNEMMAIPCVLYRRGRLSFSFAIDRKLQLTSFLNCSSWFRPGIISRRQLCNDFGSHPELFFIYIQPQMYFDTSKGRKRKADSES